MEHRCTTRKDPPLLLAPSFFSVPPPTSQEEARRPRDDAVHAESLPENASQALRARGEQIHAREPAVKSCGVQTELRYLWAASSRDAYAKVNPAPSFRRSSSDLLTIPETNNFEVGSREFLNTSDKGRHDRSVGTSNSKDLIVPKGKKASYFVSKVIGGERSASELPKLKQRMESLSSPSTESDSTPPQSMHVVCQVVPELPTVTGSSPFLVDSESSSDRTIRQVGPEVDESHLFKRNKVWHPDEVPFILSTGKKVHQLEAPHPLSSESTRSKSSSQRLSSSGSAKRGLHVRSASGSKMQRSYRNFSVGSSAIATRKEQWEYRDGPAGDRSITGNFPCKDIQYYNSTPDVRKVDRYGAGTAQASAAVRLDVIGKGRKGGDDRHQKRTLSQGDLRSKSSYSKPSQTTKAPASSRPLSAGPHMRRMPTSCPVMERRLTDRSSTGSNSGDEGSMKPVRVSRQSKEPDEALHSTEFGAKPHTPAVYNTSVHAKRSYPPSMASLSPNPSPISSPCSSLSFTPSGSTASILTAGSTDVDSISRNAYTGELSYYQPMVELPRRPINLSLEQSVRPESLASPSSCISEPACTYTSDYTSAVNPSHSLPILGRLGAVDGVHLSDVHSESDFSSQSAASTNCTPSASPLLQLTDVFQYTEPQQEENEMEELEEESAVRLTMEPLPIARLDSVINDLSVRSTITPETSLGGNASNEAIYGVDISPDKSPVLDRHSMQASPYDLGIELLVNEGLAGTQELHAETLNDAAIARAMQDEFSTNSLSTSNTAASTSSVVPSTSNPGYGISMSPSTLSAHSTAEHSISGDSDSQLVDAGPVDQTSAPSTENDSSAAGSNYHHGALNNLFSGVATMDSTGTTESTPTTDNPGYGVHLGTQVVSAEGTPASGGPPMPIAGATGAVLPASLSTCLNDYELALQLQQEFDAEIAQQMQREDPATTSGIQPHQEG